MLAAVFFLILGNDAKEKAALETTPHRQLWYYCLYVVGIFAGLAEAFLYFSLLRSLF